MPFTMMADLSHSYHDVATQKYEISWHILNPAVVLQNLPHFYRGDGLGDYNYFWLFFNGNLITKQIQHAFFSFYTLLIPINTWFDPAVLQTDVGNEFMEHTYIIEKSLLSNEPVFLKIFLLKLPYLLFDIGVLLILPLFFNNPRKKKFAFLFWLFNPVALVISFIFGSVDIICVFFVLLTFYMFYRKRYVLGIIFLGLSAFSKFQALLLIPFLFLFLFKSKDVFGSRTEGKKALLWPKILFITLIIFIIPLCLWFFGREVSKRWPFNYLFVLKIGELHAVYLFFLAYALILLAYWYFGDKSFQTLCKFCLLGLFSFFALCPFHPQWFIVVMPFICFVLIENRNLIKVFFLQLIFYFLIFLWWGNHITINLFAPLNPNLIFNIPAIKDVLYDINLDILINSFRAIFIAVTFFFMYLIIRSLNLKNDKKYEKSQKRNRN